MRNYKKYKQLIILAMVVFISTMIGRAMPVYREVITEKKTVVSRVEVQQNYGAAKEFDDVCQGWPGIIKTVYPTETATYFILQPVGDTYTVPCQITGYWPEFKVGDQISIPAGKVSGYHK